MKVVSPSSFLRISPIFDRFCNRVIVASNLPARTFSASSCSVHTPSRPLSSAIHCLPFFKGSQIPPVGFSGTFSQRRTFRTTRIVSEIQTNKMKNETSDQMPAKQDIPNTKHDGNQSKRWSSEWWREKAIVWTVFAITGSASAFTVRPLIQTVLQLEGTLMDGPNSFRLAYFAIMMPSYSVLLLLVGTLFGRHLFFRNFVLKMWSRVIPPLKKFIK